MPNPMDLPDNVYLISHSDGRFEPSSALVNLLVEARSKYDWPRGTGAKNSQQTIINLENIVAAGLARLTADSAHKIVKDVYV